MGLFKFLAYVAGGMGAATGTPWVGPAVPNAGDAKHQAMFSRVADAFKAQSNNEPFIAALFTLAVAVAFIDGEIVAAERREMDEFLAVLATTGFSAKRIAEFRDMYETPPTCEEALACIEKAGVERELVSDLVQLVVDADGKVTIEEFELLAKLSISRPV
jgi:tellurite resistance protein